MATYERTNVRTEVPRFPSGNAARQRTSRKRVSSAEKYAVLKAVADALRRHSFPSLDTGAKNIVASQVGDLLRGGWTLADITHEAVELALSWTQQRGHNRILHLASRVRAAYWAAENDAHKARKAEAMGVVSVHGAVRGMHPSTHPFVRGDEPNSCAFAVGERVCRGPIGVHVKAVRESSPTSPGATSPEHAGDVRPDGGQ